MSFTRLRRAARAAAALAAVLALAACGSSTIESELVPTRFVSFGDSASDLGSGGTRYTVNDGSINIYTQQIAARYGQGLSPTATGGTSYARGNARITAKPDAAGNPATRTVTEQIDDFVAGGGRFGDRDVVLVNGGIADVIAQQQNGASDAQRVANLQVAARELAAQVRRLVGLGAKYVLVAGTYDLGRTPWAASTGRAGALSQQSLEFNTALLIAINDLGTNVLYLDMADYVNRMINSPGNFALGNVTAVACTSTDPGPGIGIGLGQVNSARCTPATIAPGLDYNATLFADKVYLTPTAQRQIGNLSFDKLKARF
jgi:outer membrane lipase/esterase